MSKYLEVIYECEPEVTAPPHRPRPDLAKGTEREISNKYDGSPEAPVLEMARPVNATAVELAWYTSHHKPVKFVKLFYTKLDHPADQYTRRHGDWATRDLPVGFGISR
ncbi:hypothetical protein EGW08_007773, partial [Elysia chlorotica]